MWSANEEKREFDDGKRRKAEEKRRGRQRLGGKSGMKREEEGRASFGSLSDRNASIYTSDAPAGSRWR